MNRKAPLTMILTDQNVCLKEAIEKKVPSTKHVICKWVIAARFPSWFGANLGVRYKDWKNEFDRLYNMNGTVAFDLGWNDTVLQWRVNLLAQRRGDLMRNKPDNQTRHMLARLR